MTETMSLSLSSSSSSSSRPRHCARRRRRTIVCPPPSSSPPSHRRVVVVIVADVVSFALAFACVASSFFASSSPPLPPRAEALISPMPRSSSRRAWGVGGVGVGGGMMTVGTGGGPRGASPSASFRRRTTTAVEGGGGGKEGETTTTTVPPKSSARSAERHRRLSDIANVVNDAIDEYGSKHLRTFHARIGVVVASSSEGGDDENDDDEDDGMLRLGLYATKSQTKDDSTIGELSYNDEDGSGLALSPNIATNLVYRDVLPEGYDGWTGDVGLLGMLLLNEMARCDVTSGGGGRGTDLPNRKDGGRELMSAWISSLPSHVEMSTMHPLMWNDGDQEVMQRSSTKKIYRLLDDIDDDASWLDDKLWRTDRTRFPETISIRVGGGNEVEERPCFTPDGFRYAISIVRSRSFYVDGSLRLLPYLDYANHDDVGTREISGGSVGGVGMWGTSTRGASLKCGGGSVNVGEEVRVSYGPKGPADYLLDHGFVPPMCRVITTKSTSTKVGGNGRRMGSAVTAELTFEVDDADRFRDDKLDILEHDTYDLAPMEPCQSFDVVGGSGSTGEPDPAMMQFLRLATLGGKDAFLLESIFRGDVWGFMSEPVSEDNERGAVNAVIEACQNALSEMTSVADDDGIGGGESSSSRIERLCSLVRESEREALGRTLAYMKQEAEALDLKEYYQERRLKSLGLDSDWTPEDDVSFGGTRLPGTANYDW